MMTPYRVPAGESEIELIEKKSRFISRIFKIESAEQAQEILQKIRKQHWDASHNVHAYILENGVMRMSDDGEPQGTAGMPTLEVLRKEEIKNVLCITTRYFGGTLLGAGGLTRTYGKACKQALDAAGIAVMQPFDFYRLDCPYGLLETVRRQLGGFDAAEESADYGASVVLTVCLPAERGEDFCAHMVDKTNGTVRPERQGQKLFAKKLD